MLLWSIRKERNSFLWTRKAMNQVDIHCRTQAWLQEYRKWHESKNSRGIGAVIRDDQGVFVAAMAARMRGVKYAEMAETMAARAAVHFV
ncbi:hypothetical protein EV2_036123 [Malus domestica]